MESKLQKLEKDLTTFAKQRKEEKKGDTKKMLDSFFKRVEKLVGGPKKRASADKDKPKVKRAPSAYILFSSDKRPEIKKSHPDATFGETGKLLGAAWRESSQKVKDEYTRRSNQQKADMGLPVSPKTTKPKATKKTAAKPASRSASPMRSVSRSASPARGSSPMRSPSRAAQSASSSSDSSDSDDSSSESDEEPKKKGGKTRK
uniref:HMG box domain-containing protein n=1 Tax=viral metagenome TaxID=1070528 RepID=A0A6C0AF89_9ZZZZ